MPEMETKQFTTRENPYVRPGADPPKPYREPKASLDGLWEKEPWEACLDDYEGFLTDYIAATRGIEAPSKFFVWTALHLLSATLKRDAYLGWHFDNLYPNIYVILVAIPGICKKTTAIRSSKKIATHLPEYLPNQEWQYRKMFNMHQGKATPEGLQDLLRPIEWAAQDSDNNIKIVKRGSQIALMVGELTDFLGRAKHSTGLTTKLVTLYDGEDKSSDYTRGGGSHPLEDIYISMISATTPSAIENELPDEARGGGFISRTLIVYQDYPTRSYPLPIKEISGAPSLGELTRRLAWIAMNAEGEYTLSEEAREEYFEWYPRFQEHLVELGDAAAGYDRMATNLLKVALLIRASRYETGTEISVEDFRLAKHLVTEVYAFSKKATEHLGMTPQMKILTTVSNYIEKKTAVQRIDLLRRMSSQKIMSDDVTRSVIELRKTMMVTIYRDGREVEFPSSSTKEIYVWAESDDGSQDWEAYIEKSKKKKSASGRPRKENMKNSETKRRVVQRSLNSSDSNSPISARPTSGMVQSKLLQNDLE